MKKIIAAVLLAFLAIPAVAQDTQIPANREQISLSFAPVVKKVSPAVVNIYTQRVVERREGNPFMADPFFAPFFRNNMMGGRMRKQVEKSLGSGVLVQADGLVVTNSHVVKDADEIMVVLSDGREFEGKVVLKDDPSDLALVRIDTKGENLPYVTMKPSEQLEVGDLVLAIGNPFGVGQTVTSGIISALARSSLDINDFNFFIQTDAAINPGNSGGPLVAMDGGVVGINAAIYSRDGGSLGIGFAIPSEMVATVIAAEKSGHTASGNVTRAWLGVQTQDITGEIATSLGMNRPTGMLISALHPASPLAKAGIKVGDAVIAINDHPIHDSAEAKFRMATVPLGKTASFKVFRAGAERSFDVLAMAAPDSPPRAETRITGRNPLNGATLANLNPAVAGELGLHADEEGVVVSKTDDESYAARLVTPGDILVSINGMKIDNVKTAERSLKSAQGGYAMTIKRGDQLRQITIR